MSDAGSNQTLADILRYMATALEHTAIQGADAVTVVCPRQRADVRIEVYREGLMVGMEIAQTALQEMPRLSVQHAVETLLLALHRG